VIFDLSKSAHLSKIIPPLSFEKPICDERLARQLGTQLKKFKILVFRSGARQL